MITPTQIVMEGNTERELHMMGDMVAVCWNLETKQLKKIIAGIEYTGLEEIRVGDPYIDFVWIRQDSRTGELYEDEDSPIDGGIDIKQAKMLVIELQLAIGYMNELENDKISTASN